MFNVKDNKQGYIFDPFEYLGPKRLADLKFHGRKYFAVRYFQHCLLNLKSLWTIRKHLTEEGLYVEMFEKVTSKLAELFKVDFDKQRLDLLNQIKKKLY